MRMTTRRWELVLLIIAMFFIFALRVPYLGNAPNEYQGWRQSDTETIAWNFAEHRLNIFFPQLNYDGPLPNYVQLELQLTTFLIALLYKIFGVYYVLARIVPLLFFMGSCLFLYLLARKIYGSPAALSALFLYGIFPYNIFISRAIMPEAAALFFYIGAFYYFLCWQENKSDFILFTAAIFTALAISEKIPTVFIGIPMVFLVFINYGYGIFRNKRLIFFALLSLGLPYLYYFWLGNQAETAYVTGIAKGQVLPGLLNLGSGNWSFLGRTIIRLYTYQGLAIYALGLLSSICRNSSSSRKEEITLLVWNLAMWLEAISIAAVIKLDYYLVFLGPLLALQGGKFLAGLTGKKLGRLLTALLMLSILFYAWHDKSLYYQVNNEITQHAAIIQRITSPADLLVIGDPDPELLNISRRQGWRASLFFPGDPAAEIRFFLSHGARYFAPVSSSGQPLDNRYLAYLALHFENISPVNSFPVYDLQRFIP